MAVVDINQAVMERAGLPSYSSKEILALAENDRATWDIFSKGYTCGINQCGGAATTKKLMQYKPRCLEDLSAFVAAIRPGFKSQLSKFLARERFTYGIPSFDNILRNDTSGSSWLLYQENIMTCLSFAGFTMEETYPIIKAISKKKQEVIAAAKERFLEGFSQYIMAQSGVHEAKAREQSETVWQVIEDSSNYSFNACVPGRQALRVYGDKGKSVTVYRLLIKKSERDALLYSMFDNHRFHGNRLVNVSRAGKQSVYHVETKCGASILCTINHKFPTPNGQKPLSELKEGDFLYVFDDAEGYAATSPITSIEYICDEMTYDIEMSDPAHNFVTDTGLVACNSHAVAVSIDAIYGAYLKAHYPLEYYTVLLENYAKKGDKDKIAEIKDEMQRAFGIRIAPCRFRQDNRAFAFDKETSTITDTLRSVKNISARVADVLYRARDKCFDSFTDVLYWLDEDPAFNARSIYPLIHMGYFEEFGSTQIGRAHV